MTLYYYPDYATTAFGQETQACIVTWMSLFTLVLVLEGLVLTVLNIHTMLFLTAQVLKE